MYHAPIYGSQFNPLAKLFKRFEPTEETKIDSKTIEIEGVHYRTYHSLPWVEATDKEIKEEQKADGGLLKTGDLLIKFNGLYEPAEGSECEPEHHDIISINDKWWMIEGAIKRKKNRLLADSAVVFLPLKKIERNKINGGKHG